MQSELALQLCKAYPGDLLLEAQEEAPAEQPEQTGEQQPSQASEAKKRKK